MAGCLGEEAEKTGKGTGRERIWHCAAPAKSPTHPNPFSYR